MKLHVWLIRTRNWLRQFCFKKLGKSRKNRSFLRSRAPFAEVMEQRLLLTSGHTDGHNLPGEYFYSLADAAYVYNSDDSRIFVDDSDIVRLTVHGDGSWQHELYFDGSDVGLTSDSEDIDAFTLRADGSLLISTLARVTVPGVQRITGADLLLFQPTSTGHETSGSWQMFFDTSDVALWKGAHIDAAAELDDGRLVVSFSNNGRLPDIGYVRHEDLSVSRQHRWDILPRARGLVIWTAATWACLVPPKILTLFLSTATAP